MWGIVEQLSQLLAVVVKSSTITERRCHYFVDDAGELKLAYQRKLKLELQLGADPFDIGLLGIVEQLSQLLRRGGEKFNYYRTKMRLLYR